MANGHKDTKAESTGEKFFAPISHSPIPDLHFSLFTSHFSWKFTQISADNFVKIDGKFLVLNSCFFISSLLTSHFPKLHFPIFRCHAAPDCVDAFFYYYYKYFCCYAAFKADSQISILQPPFLAFHFSLPISLESSRWSSQKKDFTQISADNFVKIDGKFLGLNSYFFTSSLLHFSIVHYPLIHSCPLKITVQSLSWAVQE